MPDATSKGLLSLQPIAIGCLHSNAKACFMQGGLAIGEGLGLPISVLSLTVAFRRGYGVAFVRASTATE